MFRPSTVPPGRGCLDGAAGPGSKECGAEEQLGPGDAGQLFLHGCADRLPRAAPHPLIDGGERPHGCGPELRQPPGRAAGNLEIQDGPASASGKGPGATSDDLCALGHLRQGVRGQDRVDPGGEVEAGRVGVHEADIAPAVLLDPVLGPGEHRVGQIDADDPATGTDRLLEQAEVQARAARHVDHAVTRAEAERPYGPEALLPLGIAGRRVEPAREVVVLRLLAVGLDQALLRTAGLAHDALRAPDSTAALIAAISASLTRWILPWRRPAGIARMMPARSTSIHIMASVFPPSAGSNSIPHRAADVPMGPANAM